MEDTEFLRKDLKRTVIDEMGLQAFNKQSRFQGEKAKRIYIEAFSDGYVAGVESFAGTLNKMIGANSMLAIRDLKE